MADTEDSHDSPNEDKLEELDRDAKQREGTSLHALQVPYCILIRISVNFVCVRVVSSNTTYFNVQTTNKQTNKQTVGRATREREERGALSQ